MLEVQSLASGPRVFGVVCPMYRWCINAGTPDSKEEVVRQETRWLASSKEIGDVLRCNGRWKPEESQKPCLGTLCR